MKNLVIVESPAKANTIGKYLGSDYTVMASYGHIRDLPSKDGSVLPDENFEMKWEVDPKAKKRIDEMNKAVKLCDNVLLATDPDREGEAISWHVREVLKEAKGAKDKVFKRVVFNEITKKAIVSAVENPRQINMGLVDAYMARRALDYLVGFTLSPVLWRKLPGSRSAGRVQSVALRIICDREAEIEAFRTQEYWSVHALMETQQKAQFMANLVELAGKKIDKLTIQDQLQAQQAVDKLKTCEFTVNSIDRKEVKRNPYAPFYTSTLQQEASKKLGFTATRTMQIAQRLYEGIQLEGETVGLITYMRTDGVNMAQEAVQSMREFITKEYGNKYLPETPKVYKSKTANAQEAHEAIRPTEISRTPQSVQEYLDHDQFRLYELIWKRALSSQMTNAIFDQMSVEITAQKREAVLRASGSVMVFDGFIRLYQEEKQEDKEEKAEKSEKSETVEETDNQLPQMKEGELLACQDVLPEQHFTKPPARYTEAALIKKLEELGIGRPSTYASIIRILQDRNYVHVDSKRFFPEDRGVLVTTFLSNFFDKYVQYDFTANLEEKLDEIAQDKATSKKVLGDFWKDFKGAVDSTKDLTITVVLDTLNDSLAEHFFPVTEENPEPRKCKSCETGTLGLRLGKFGAFIGCSNYPDCKFTRQLKAAQGEAALESFANTPVELGLDPVTSKKVFVCKGPYGFYVQLGEEEEVIEEAKPAKETKTLKTTKKTSKTKAGEAEVAKPKKEKKPKVIKPKRSSIPQSTNPTELTLDGALSLLSLPREIGIFPETGDMISAGLGRFGPYLKFGATFVSLKAEDDVLTVALERAIEVIVASGKKRMELGEYKKKPVAVQKGRFGFFVVFNKLRVAIPKSKEAESLTLDEAIELIEKKIGKPKEVAEKPDKETKATKVSSKKTPAKKAAVKKTTASKSASKTKVKK